MNEILTAMVQIYCDVGGVYFFKMLSRNIRTRRMSETKTSTSKSKF